MHVLDLQQFWEESYSMVSKEENIIKVIQKDHISKSKEFSQHTIPDLVNELFLTTNIVNFLVEIVNKRLVIRGQALHLKPHISKKANQRDNTITKSLEFLLESKRNNYTENCGNKKFQLIGYFGYDYAFYSFQLYAIFVTLTQL